MNEPSNPQLQIAEEPRNASLFQRLLITPVVDLLSVGCTPRKLAWSLAAGLVIGINPLLGSTTLVCLVLAFILRLNLVASQIANHIVYPLQLALFLVFIHVGDKLFHTGSMPLTTHELFYGARHHPLATTRLLWNWEWHALIIWVVFAFVAAPLLATALTPLLTSLHHRLHKQEAVA